LSDKVSGRKVTEFSKKEHKKEILKYKKINILEQMKVD